MANGNEYSLIIPDKQINELYVKLQDIFLKERNDFALDLLHDLIYVFGSVEYFSKKCRRTFDKIKEGMEKHVREVVVKEVTAKDPDSSYMSFPSGETTNFNFVYDFDVYVFSLKRYFDFLAKLPAALFIGKNIKKEEVGRLDIADFIKTIKEGSKKYNSLSKNFRKEVPNLVLKSERLEGYINTLETLRDKLIHRKPYKQVYFRATVHIENKSKWEILRWEFLPKTHFNQNHKLSDLLKNHTITASSDDLEPVVYNSAEQMKTLLIEVLTLVSEISGRKDRQD